MNLDITPETERIVLEELRSGHFRSVDDLIVSSVEAWREHNMSEDQVGSPTLSQAPRAGNGKDKAREFVAWAKSHRDTPPLSDESISRASLNPDRW